MKEYVFLTDCIGGITGGPSYIRNKFLWLSTQGWTIQVFDSGTLFHPKIVYKELLSFSSNRILELCYNPYYFTNKKRKEILQKILNKIDSNNVVIESNSFGTALWGELIAQNIRCKHIIYLLGENCYIEHISLYQFMFFKYKNNELFSISAQAFKSLFSKFIDIKDAENHYWNALSVTKPEDIYVKELETLCNSDYTICHFGRYKDYFPYMIAELKLFIKQNPLKKINVIFYGIESLKNTLHDELASCSNVTINYFKSTFPIPKLLFKKSDVVIATAGCAYISYIENCATISMNVETRKPLGVMGYTTNQISYKGGKDNYEIELSVLLENLLVKNLYNGNQTMSFNTFQKGYEYQISNIINKRVYYDNLKDIVFRKSYKERFIKFFLKYGMVSVLQSINRWRIKNNNR